MPDGTDPNDGSYMNVKLSLDPSWSGRFGNLWASNAQGNSADTSMSFVYSNIGDDGFTESFAPDYNATAIPGRSEAYQTYTGGSNRELTITLSFWAMDGGASSDTGTGPDGSAGSYTGGGTGGSRTPEWVVKSARWLERFKYPVFDMFDISYGPPVAILQIGQLFAGRVIMTGGDPHWRAPFVPGTMLPHGCDFDATFRVVKNFAGSTYSPPSGVPLYNTFQQFQRVTS